MALFPPHIHVTDFSTFFEHPPLRTGQNSISGPLSSLIIRLNKYFISLYYSVWLVSMLAVFCLGVVGILSKQSVACIHTANGIFRQRSSCGCVFLGAVKVRLRNFSVVSELQRFIYSWDEATERLIVDIWSSSSSRESLANWLQLVSKVNVS